MATLKEFEDALRQNGMVNALAILETLKKRDRETRSIAPARRVVGRKMTADLARSILEMHASTGMTQQEIAFKLGVNQGRVNEVIKRGKWLNAGPTAPEIQSRDKAMERLAQRAKARRVDAVPVPVVGSPAMRTQLEPGRAVPSTNPTKVGIGPIMERKSSELPLERPDAVKLNRLVATKAKPSIDRPHAPTSAPIVSAQLAFLDL